MAGIGDIVEDVALLQAQCSHDRQYAFDETAAVGAVGPEAGLAPHDTVSHATLGEVVRRLDTLDVDEGPERGLQLQDLATSARNGAHRECTRLTRTTTVLQDRPRSIMDAACFVFCLERGRE